MKIGYKKSDNDYKFNFKKFNKLNILIRIHPITDLNKINYIKEHIKKLNKGNKIFIFQSKFIH